MNQYMTTRDALNQELASRGLRAWTEKQPGEFMLAVVAAVDKLVKDKDNPKDLEIKND